MSEHPAFRLGVENLTLQHADWIAGRRIGLISHSAALTRDGSTSAERLIASGQGTLAALFGPEHGYIGDAGAGQTVTTQRHPIFKLPVYSLYGAHRKPTPAMLKGLDVIIFDMQSLPVRCYTYLATLQLAMEACVESGLPLIVADRPIPLANTIDGRLPEDGQSSFVCPVSVPLAYAMTPAESALWLREALSLDLDLRIARMTGYHREEAPGPLWPPWYPPSPAIVAWQSALAYPATVAFEAFGDILLFRKTALAFQAIGASWMNAARICEAFDSHNVPGVRLHPHVYYDREARASRPCQGVRLSITDARRYRPAHVALALISAVQTTHGKRKLWHGAQARPAFFDTLMGGPAIRESLLAGASPKAILASGLAGMKAFTAARVRHLLYPAAVPPLRRAPRPGRHHPVPAS